MKHRIAFPLTASACLFLFSAAAAFGQGADDGRKLNFGIRVDYIPLRMFDTFSATASTTSPVADYTYRGSSSSPKIAFGPVGEWRLMKHLSLGVELSYHRTEYKQVTEIRSGKKDPNAPTDNRQVTTITDTSRVNNWDIPILARYYGIRKAGIFRRFYPLGGVTIRHTGRVRTGNEIQNADGTTDYNEKSDPVAKAYQFGGTVGIGYRFADELGVKLTPEIRFTRWMGHNIEGRSYRSDQNQAQVGIGITF